MFNIADLEHVSEIFTRLLFFIMSLPVSSEICSKKFERRGTPYSEQPVYSRKRLAQHKRNI